MAALCLIAFVVMVDTTIIQVMVPDLMRGLGASLEQVLWVVNGFVLVYAALLITAGRAGGIVGPRPLLIAGLLLFGSASFACGLATSPEQLIIARVAQGIGGAMIVPQSLTLVALMFPENRRGAALGVVSATMALAAIVGPVGGGAIITAWGWRWAFLINVPICLLALAMALRYVPGMRPDHHQSLDWGGVALVTAGLGAITYGLVEGERYGWGTVAGPVTIPSVLTAGLLLLCAFAWWEHRHAAPVLPLGLFRYRSFVVAGWLACVQFVVMLGLMLVITLHVQRAQAGSAIDAGLILLPMAVMAGLLSPLAGWLTDRVGGGRIIMAGFAAMAAGVAWFALLISPSVPVLGLALPSALVGAGVGLVMAPASTEAVRGLPASLVPAASGVLNTGRQLAGLLGVTLVGVILQTGSAVRETVASGRHEGADAVLAGAFTAAARPALITLAAVALLAALACLLLRSRPSRSPSPQMTSLAP
ncbi:putative drug resistance transporter, EmrB/QacA subfamily protein [Planomonospora parontospora]|uniref:Drug resistance transporter, EmrB/QacA subfamily protein n=2 Tax=Planomonospora parontospora TaxID=58119 RepID=A0AA37BIP6_9ACTN|nr:putative drug resistance transporter, EmrB/QacA subfamily protein [Planomonospora parontospora]